MRQSPKDRAQHALIIKAVIAVLVGVATITWVVLLGQTSPAAKTDGDRPVLKADGCYPVVKLLERETWACETGFMVELYPNGQVDTVSLQNNWCEVPAGQLHQAELALRETSQLSDDEFDSRTVEEKANAIILGKGMEGMKCSRLERMPKPPNH